MVNVVGNAEMTELFKCRKSGTQCCAPKSVIREYQEQKQGGVNAAQSPSRNDSVASQYRPNTIHPGLHFKNIR